MTDRLKLFLEIVNGLRSIPLAEFTKLGSKTDHDWQKLMNEHGLIQSRIFLSPFRIVGLTADAKNAAKTLARAIWEMTTDYKAGCRAAVFEKAVEDLILGQVRWSPIQSDLCMLEEKIRIWFSESSEARTHLIACRLIPSAALPFAVGPVSFEDQQCFLASNDVKNSFLFNDTDGGIKHKEWLGNTFSWIAKVTVIGRQADRSREIAEHAVDIALAGIQIIFSRHEDADGMRRVNALSVPGFVQHVCCLDGKFGISKINQVVGMLIHKTAFDKALLTDADFMRSVGRRVENFINRKSPLQNLELAWCDAAYWYHEARAEPVGSVAIAKYETCLEVLFGAESTKKSTMRIEQAIKVILKLDGSDNIYSGPHASVHAFASELVRSRSRILHGTFSTMNDESKLPLAIVQIVASKILAEATIMLDKYIAANEVGDNAESFLKWAGELPLSEITQQNE
jgi:hypothetical protein